MTTATLIHAEVPAALDAFADGTFPCVVTSPRYNMGASPSAKEHPHSSRGLAFPDFRYEADRDDTPEPAYQAEQLAFLQALYRVCAAGASVFYIHKDRVWGGCSISPRAWLDRDDQPFIVRQQITWDRGNTHNRNGYNFDPENEWVFWLTKGKVSRHLGPAARWGTVWRIPIRPSDLVPWHPCPFPLALAERCVLAGSAPGDLVLDPFAGSGTSGLAALRNHRAFVGIDRQVRYVAGMRERLATYTPVHPALSEVS